MKYIQFLPSSFVFLQFKGGPQAIVQFLFIQYATEQIVNERIKDGGSVR